MGNTNKKASVMVKHSEDNQEGRGLTKGSSELQGDEQLDVQLTDGEKKERGRVRRLPHPNPGLPKTVTKAMEGEQVAAGWPSWLSAVAGEAIMGLVPRRADSFEKLDKIGQGSYSNVYKARDLIHNKIVALKKVQFDIVEPESVRFMAREILILRRLDHPNVIKLDGLITSRMSSSLYLIFEYMEHDLSGLISTPDIKFTEPQVKCFMHQLLCGLEYCHNQGVLHRDIKTPNLLINDDGILKIADFGLSSFFDPRHLMTSRVVTLWYRPLELLLGATKYGVEVDLWSSGCILGELCTGKPILQGRTEVEQMHRIFKLCGSPSEDFWRKSELPHKSIFKPQNPYKRCLGETFKDFPAVIVNLLESLLSLDPESRGTAALALKSEFFTTKPFACDPSSLPKYPPNKAARDKAVRPGAPIRFRVMRPDDNDKLAGLREQMPEEHDHRIQAASGQGRIGSSIDVDKMLEEYDRHIQEVDQRMRVERRKVGNTLDSN